MNIPEWGVSIKRNEGSTCSGIYNYNSIVNISMQGELKEFNDAVPIGETHQLDFEIFKNSSDTNIQLLIQLMSKVEETFDTLSNINGIEIEEGE